nr:substrate-binding domain-containing protein [Rhodovibrio sodomensis]
MKKTFAIAAAVAAVTALPSGDAAAQAREQIRIVGSSTVYPFATSVVEQFGKETQYPTPVIESTGSGGGLQLFCAGVGAEHPDITNASRRIKPSEVKRCQENGVQKITEVKIGADGIVFANSVEGPDADFQLKHIWQALAAQVPQDGELVKNPYETWADIDSSLPDKKIEIYGPPPTSGTRDAWNELAMMGGCKQFDMIASMSESKMEEACLTYRSDGAWIEAGENDTLIVQKLNSNTNAYGIFGYSFLDQNRNTIQAAKINGVAPTVENISADQYPISRSLWFYVKNAHVGVIPGIEAYVKEFTRASTWGPNGYLVEKGLIPMPEQQRNAWRQKARNFEPLNPEEIMG